MGFQSTGETVVPSRLACISPEAMLFSVSWLLYGTMAGVY